MKLRQYNKAHVGAIVPSSLVLIGAYVLESTWGVKVPPEIQAAAVALVTWVVVALVPNQAA